MELVVYKVSHYGFYNREIRKFSKFPSKEECARMGLVVAHPMNDSKIELHRSGKYIPPATL